MEYDLHKDLDGLGERLNLEVNERIRCSADKGARYVDVAANRLVELARAYRKQPVRRYKHWKEG